MMYLLARNPPIGMFSLLLLLSLIAFSSGALKKRKCVCRDGSWSSWTEVSRASCSKTCGKGFQKVVRTRSCSNPNLSKTVKRCYSKTQLFRCNIQNCTLDSTSLPAPHDNGWSNWNEWKNKTRCSALCGGGEIIQTRYRECDNSAKAILECNGLSDEIKTIACNTGDCGAVCPEGEDTYLANEQDNSHFYQCEPGHGNITTKAVLKRCPQKTVWSQKDQVCIRKPDSTTTSSCVNGAIRADPEDCQYYLICVHGKEVRIICAGGTKFDQSLMTCNYADQVTC